MSFRLISFTLVLGALLQSGCYTMHNECNECLSQKRDECDAMRAWWRYKRQYRRSTRYIHDFGHGFRSAYMSVMAGGDGCPPTLAPQKYWCTAYESASGRDRVAAWFEGWSAGVFAAEADGVRGRHMIPMFPRGTCNLDGLPIELPADMEPRVPPEGTRPTPALPPSPLQGIDGLPKVPEPEPAYPAPEGEVTSRTPAPAAVAEDEVGFSTPE